MFVLSRWSKLKRPASSLSREGGAHVSPYCPGVIGLAAGGVVVVGGVAGTGAVLVAGATGSGVVPLTGAVVVDDKVDFDILPAGIVTLLMDPDPV